jgi:hypothetical protein
MAQNLAMEVGPLLGLRRAWPRSRGLFAFSTSILYLGVCPLVKGLSSRSRRGCPPSRGLSSFSVSVRFLNVRPLLGVCPLWVCPLVEGLLPFSASILSSRAAFSGLSAFSAESCHHAQVLEHIQFYINYYIIHKVLLYFKDLYPYLQAITPKRSI